MRVQRLFAWGAAALLLAVAASVAVFALLRSFNHFEPVETAFAGSCSPVIGVAGPEDLQIDPATRLAFVSSLDRRAGDGEGERGSVLAFSLDDPLAETAWRDRTDGVPARFEPLGLHFWSDGTTRRLFVVNAAADAVELYDVGEDGALAHLGSFSERRLTSPNDVVGVGPRAFYVSNDAEAGRDSLLGRLQFVLRQGAGKIMHYDGASWRVSAEGLKFANGLAVDRAGTRLYAAETAASALSVYARDPATGAISLLRREAMPAAIDNLNIDPDGALWIAGHPKPLLLPAYARDPEGRAPSIVLRYDASENGGAATRVYADDGAELSASTAASRLGSTLLIGALLERKFLICDLAS